MHFKHFKLTICFVDKDGFSVEIGRYLFAPNVNEEASLKKIRHDGYPVITKAFLKKVRNVLRSGGNHGIGIDVEELDSSYRVTGGVRFIRNTNDDWDIREYCPSTNCFELARESVPKEETLKHLKQRLDVAVKQCQEYCFEGSLKEEK